MNESIYQDLQLRYFAPDGQVRAMKITLKFLSPSLRAMIIRHDSEAQKAFRKFQEEFRANEAAEREQNIRNEIARHIESLRSAGIEPDEETIKTEKNILTARLLSDMPDEEIQRREETLINNWAHNDRWTVRFFKLIVNAYALSEEDRQQFNTADDSGFWSSVDIDSVGEINKSFRKLYKI